MLARVDVPQATRGISKPDINRKTHKVGYSMEMLGALLGIDKEILRASYDPDRHALYLYVYDPSMDSSEERLEGQETLEVTYLPSHILENDSFWEPAE
jgi:hypothetical protein